MKCVLYEFKPHKKINGTLFYCFEYYCLLRKRELNARFLIYRISSRDLDKVKAIFREKYLVEESSLENILGINSISELYSLTGEKTLILDIKTFEQLYMFIRGDILCFSSEAHPMVRSNKKKITYYGHYEYQNFDIECMLKLNFDIFRPLNSEACREGVLLSSLSFNFEAARLPDKLKNKPIIKKVPQDHHENLFERFDTLYYIHTAQDTNNRLIPESFFYNKEVYLQDNGLPKDSAYYRYHDIKENGLAAYWLDETDRLAKDFWGEP